jgi:hypothetical protein
MVHSKTFLFTITPGHTGTMYLASLLQTNIPSSKVYHEMLGYSSFGVHTPDVSHLTLFNSQGNVTKVQQFWQQKFIRLINDDSVSFYGETSHMLAKSGLMENLHQLIDYGNINIICLKRDTSKVMGSLIKRFDFLNKGNMWLWHLDPDYPRKILNPQPFKHFGINGIRLWYVYEMYTRAEYYKLLFADQEQVNFINVDISDLSDADQVKSFIHQLKLPSPPAQVTIPERKNISKTPLSEVEINQVKTMIDKLKFDPKQLAGEFFSRGNRL